MLAAFSKMKTFITLLAAGTLGGILSHQGRSAISCGLSEVEQQIKRSSPEDETVREIVNEDGLCNDQAYNSKTEWRGYVNNPSVMLSIHQDENVREVVIEEQISNFKFIEDLAKRLEKVKFQSGKKRAVTARTLSELRIYCHHFAKLAENKFPGSSERVLKLFPDRKDLVLTTSEKAGILFNWLGRMGLCRVSSPRVTGGAMLSKEEIIHGLREYFENISDLPLEKGSNWKVKLEILVLKMVNQMYRFKLIDKSELHDFFRSPSMISLTGRHIAKVFPQGMGLDVEQKYCFQAELNYLTLIGPTRHLWHCLADLETDLQRKIIHASWSVSYEISSYVSDWHPPQSQLRTVTDIIGKNDFLVKLDFWEHGWPDWAKKVYPSKDRDLGPTIGILIENFRRPVIQRKKISLRKIEKEDYLLNFFSLHYVLISLDDPRSLQRQLIAEQNAYKEFCAMMDFLSCGKLLYEWIMYGLKPPKNATPQKRKLMAVPQSPEETQLIRQIVVLERKYLELEAEIEERASKSKDVQAWKNHPAVSSLIESFSRGSTLFHTYANMGSGSVSASFESNHEEAVMFPKQNHCL